jgi:hypothetical protein
MLWSHVRNIDVNVYSHKVVYRIPLYGDFIFKNAKLELCSEGRELKLTTCREPIQPRLEESSCDSLIDLKVLPVESDKCLELNQPPCHKTKSCNCASLATFSHLLS